MALQGACFLALHLSGPYQHQLGPLAAAAAVAAGAKQPPAVGASLPCPFAGAGAIQLLQIHRNKHLGVDFHVGISTT